MRVLTSRCQSADTSRDGLGYGLLGIADATGHVRIHRLEGELDGTAPRELRLRPFPSWRINSKNALCLSLDWSDRVASEALNSSPETTRLLVSQSDGTLAVASGLEQSSCGAPRELETWAAHSFEAWVAAWDCWSGGTVLWSGAFCGRRH